MARRWELRAAVTLALVLVSILLVALAAGSMTLQEAIDDPSITIVIEAKGSCIYGDCHRLVITNHSPTDTIGIDVQPGDVIVPRDGGFQRFVITRDQVIVLGPGQTVDLPGLWTSCIDPYKPAPPGGITYDAAPNLREIFERFGYDVALAMYEFVLFINDHELYSAPEAFAALSALASGEFPMQDRLAADLLYEAGFGPRAMPEPLGEFILPHMDLEDGRTPIFSQTINLDDLADISPIHCFSCATCDFESLMPGTTAPIFVHNGLVFVAGPGTALEVMDFCPADGQNELAMGQGTFTIAFPNPVSCVEIHYCHGLAGTFTAKDNQGNVVMSRGFAARQSSLVSVVLNGEGISTVEIAGEELFVTDICTSP